MFIDRPKAMQAAGSDGRTGAAASGPIVFIVDDDAAVRDSLSLLVQAWGWTPRSCASAEEFLECYSRQRDACLLLDLQMPGISGADLQEILVELSLQLPTIIITGHPDHALTSRAMAAGALAVVAKPFRHDHLLSCIERALSIAH